MIKKCKAVVLNSYYSHYYYKQGLDEKLILIESKNGSDLAGNIFYLLKELTSDTYKSYTVVLSCREEVEKEIREKLEKYRLKNIKFVHTHTYHYYKLLATAKYLFTDTTFTRSYVKKSGQVIVNTWHGTPLKKMGRDLMNRSYAMGNVQRNLLYADYLIYPNEYMKEKMTKAYHLDVTYEGTILNEGYPRNSIFFEKEAGSYIRKELNLEGKQMLVYMPTWRGTLDDMDTESLLEDTRDQLIELDGKLKENQVIFVKFHPFVHGGIDFSDFSHIKPYPNQYDVYEFLNQSDGLITDYSSVFYDYANTKKKIILWAYDEEEYCSDRGMYVDIHELPFPVVKQVDELISEINTPKNYEDGMFLKECCTYDGPDAAKRICEHVILGQKVCQEEKIKRENKDKILMYGSALALNGLTTSMLNLFHNIDTKEREYFVTFLEAELKKEPFRVQKLPEEVGIMPISSSEGFTFLEAVAYTIFFKFNKENKFTRKYLDRLYEREIMKHFGGVNFDYFIQFAGYEKKVINLFERFHGSKFIYVHNDMMAEMKTRGNQHFLTLQSAYQNYDKVAVVTRDIKAATMKIGKKEENIVIVNNCHAYHEVRRKAELPIAFDSMTQSNVSLGELKKLLDSDVKKFITIGRFSPEKGHYMLMRAFEKFAQENKDAVLIIIGGNGKLWEETRAYASNSKAKIITILAMSNPMPILKKCDLFILSSLYEGLGLTMLEADTLGIPSMSTDIVGPQGFMREHGGYLVPPTEKGLLDGMKAYMRGEIKAMNVDYEAYNKKAVSQFESLFAATRE